MLLVTHVELPGREFDRVLHLDEGLLDERGVAQGRLDEGGGNPGVDPRLDQRATGEGRLP